MISVNNIFLEDVRLFFYSEQFDSLQILILVLRIFQEGIKKKKSLKIRDENNSEFIAEKLCTSHTMLADGQDGRPCVMTRKNQLPCT